MTEELSGEFRKAENHLKTETGSGTPLAGSVQKEDIQLGAVTEECPFLLSEMRKVSYFLMILSDQVESNYNFFQLDE